MTIIFEVINRLIVLQGRTRGGHSWGVSYMKLFYMIWGKNEK